MDDFRLKIFISAARHLSFTRCAKEMFISQPAVSKHIVELEKEFKLPLFKRRGSMLELTDAGKALLHHAESITAGYAKMHYEMGMLTNIISGKLRIGASTTIAQYVLPAILAQFTELFPHVRISMQADNSEHIEKSLFENEVDLGLVENYSRKPGLQYSGFMKDELVAVAAVNGKYGKTDELSIRKLCGTPLILRENGSGTLEVVEKQLAAHGIAMSSLNVVMQLGSTEAIKSFIQNSDTIAFLSIVSVRKELMNNILRVVDIPEIDFTRDFDFVWRKSEKNHLSERFMEFFLQKIGRQPQ